MKKILFALCALLTAGTASSQWTAIQTPTTRILYDIAFPDALTGYCVGDSGTFLKTIDGGLSWSLMPTFATDALDEVYFKNADTGWVRTRNNLFKTNDGGATFQSLEPAFANTDPTKVLVLTTMSFKGNTGIINGSFTEQPQQSPFITYSSVTHDGGRTWSPATVPGGYTSKVNIVTDSIFFAADFELYKTRNGGVSWDTLPNVRFSFPPLNNKCFQIFDTAGNGVASLAYHLEYARLQAAGGTVQVIPQNTIDLITNLSFPNRDTGYALRYSDNLNYSHVWRTTDGGITYTKATTDSLLVSNLTFLDTQTGFLCGTDGKIYKTTNGGGPTAVPEIQAAEKEIGIYPNPANGVLFLKTGSLLVQSVVLADVSGRQLRTFPATAQKLDISGIAPGVYLLWVQTKDQLITRKVVLE